MTKWTSVIVICGLLSQSMPAWAQNTTPPADSTTPHADTAPSTDSTNAAPAAPPPDVVLTRAGAMVRGTISRGFAPIEADGALTDSAKRIRPCPD